MSLKPVYFALFLACFAACLSLAAQGCKQNNIAATTNNNDTVSQVVGVGGATVYGPEGSQVDIPPDALTQSTTISITVFDTFPDPPLTALPAGWTALGHTFEFQPLPPAQSFPSLHQPSILVPYTTASAHPSLATSLPGGQWVIVSSTPAGMALTAGVSQFAYFLVVDTGATTAGDAGPDCAAELAQRLAAPIVPPNKFAGYDLSTGADPRGLSIEEANDGCLTTVPLTNPPQNPGLRLMELGPSIQLGYVIDDHLINLVILGTNYSGLLSFSSRAGGTYGPHTYQIQIGQPVLRDGVSFSQPGEWNVVTNDAGVNQASEWANEIYDGIVATFHIGFAGQEECMSATNPSSCLFYENAGGTNSELGIRSIGFYIVFNYSTNVVNGVYEFYTPTNPNCQTPVSRLEEELYSPIYFPQNRSIGSLQLVSSAMPGGITASQANALLCNGVDAAAPDPGYGAMQWGDAGQILLEYNSTSQVGYKLFANPGYFGTLSFQGQSSPDAAVDSYVAGVGPNGVTKNGNPFPIDWTSESTAVPAVTELSNQLQGLDDPDCFMANDCTIVVSQGGQSIIGFSQVSTFIAFQQGTGTVQDIYNLWPGGM